MHPGGLPSGVCIQGGGSASEGSPSRGLPGGVGIQRGLSKGLYRGE